MPGTPLFGGPWGSSGGDEGLTTGDWQALLLTSQAIGSRHDAASICAWMCDVAAALLGTRLAAIALAPSPEARLTVHGNLDAGALPDEVTRAIEHVTLSDPAEALKTGAVSVLRGDDVPADLAAEGVDVLLQIRLATVRRRLGVLMVGTDRIWKPDSRHWFILSTLANQAALALENLRLRRETEEQAEGLARAKDAAEAANRAKSEFLATMSHELRTPLNAVLGFAQLLWKDDGLGPEHKEAVRIIQRSGEHLLNLIDEILDLSKIEAGKQELLESDFHLPELLANVVDIARVRAEAKAAVDFLYEPIGELPSFVRGDERKLRQVLLNVLGNAVKFTETGHVAFRARAAPVSTGRRRMRFEIEDTGIGISANRLDEIFLPFQQVSSRHEPAEGTGLGLTISRKLVELMGGAIEVESVPGEGSLFRISIELEELAPRSDEGEPPKRRVVGVGGRPRRVLVADDHPENRAVLVRLLAPLGLEVVEARDGAEAVELADAALPDAVLMDLVMPVVDGFEATRRLRSSPRLRDVVVIALSASVFPRTDAESREAGCDDFIPKPLRDDVVLEKLAAHLGIEWRYDDAPSPSPVMEPGTLPADVRQELFELARVGDIDAFLERLSTLDDAFRSRASELRRLALRYRMSELLAVLDDLS